MAENFGLLGARHVLENGDGVIGLDVAHAFGNGLRVQFVENFLANRVVDLGQRGKVEVDAQEFDQTRALVGIERFQERAEIGFVQITDQNAQLRHVDGLDGARGLGDEIGTDRAIVVAQWRLLDDLVGHAGPWQQAVQRDGACTLATDAEANINRRYSQQPAPLIRP